MLRDGIINASAVMWTDGDPVLVVPTDSEDNCGMNIGRHQKFNIMQLNVLRDLYFEGISKEPMENTTAALNPEQINVVGIGVRVPSGSQLEQIASQYSGIST